MQDAQPIFSNPQKSVVQQPMQTKHAETKLNALSPPSFIYILIQHHTVHLMIHVGASKQNCTYCFKKRHYSNVYLALY